MSPRIEHWLLWSVMAHSDAAQSTRIGNGYTPPSIFNKVILSEASEYSPSLQMFRDMLHIAWSGTQNHCLNVLSPANSRQPPASRKMTLCSETTEFSPALASFRGYLYLAWTGPDRRLNLVPREDGVAFPLLPAAGWPGKITLP